MFRSTDEKYPKAFGKTGHRLNLIRVEFSYKYTGFISFSAISTSVVSCLLKESKGTEEKRDKTKKIVIQNYKSATQLHQSIKRKQRFQLKH
ncbi:CLUMA_CG008578, isoform A [Clunio marinus]|uniref:CLUMA_CG008578, isoform A n=1 Tax=Clunio marinus TaxID=568069 RepID=A0A1J1I692_9DIPT|nr:CLUMA_CG008578, isoform A [Clunio marinus]